MRGVKFPNIWSLLSISFLLRLGQCSKHSRPFARNDYSSITNAANRPPKPFIYPQQPQLSGYQFGIIELPTERPSVVSDGPQFAVSAQPAYFCRSTTQRSHLDCPCLLIGIRCLQANSSCLADPNGDGYCGCLPGFLPLNGSCVTLAYYTQVVLAPFTLSTPILVASCFLPENSVIGKIPYIGGVTPISYNLTLLFSNFNGGDTRKFISIDAATGNVLLLRPPPVSVVNQTYQVIAKDATGVTSTIIFKVIYNCTGKLVHCNLDVSLQSKNVRLKVIFGVIFTAPTCTIDVGSPVYVECQLSSIGSTIATVLASGSVAPTRFSMVLASSTAAQTLYYQLDSVTGFIQIAQTPHGGIFTQVYNVTAMNAVGQNCTAIQVKITTSSDCV
ncbi:hypothetical protein BV898_17265 [Hypsibius exemplaris]|uniref:EGF-like domain-containing protein n=1 Tax=Hypsibius exemplaris TaxID=2072580 RepID=A0A9X6RME8_HYPEX|nr:hypothetical protein BV898_17265 [Hypsibius exemplaris]